MSAARSWGVPLSIFRGRPWPAPGEPLWLDDDRDAALALTIEDGLRCPGCGEPLDISTTREAEESYRAEAVRCHACAALGRATREVDSQVGLFARLTKRPERTAHDG